MLNLNFDRNRLINAVSLELATNTAAQFEYLSFLQQVSKNASLNRHEKQKIYDDAIILELKYNDLSLMSIADELDIAFQFGFIL